MTARRVMIATSGRTERSAARAHSVLVLVLSGVVAVLGTYTFSRAAGELSEAVTMPVGAPALALGVALCAWSPRSYGLRLGTTSRHLVLIGISTLAVAMVVVAFRLTGSAAPYDATVGEFVLVPVGEELLFRGFLLGVLLQLFDRRGVSHSAAWAVLISAAAFGVGHLGNLGYVETTFVLLQVVVATLFGTLAGYVRWRTGSVVGPALMHSTMNVLAVVT